MANGIKADRHRERLDTAIHDARAVGEVLANHHGFDVTLLTVATRGDIVEVPGEYRNRLRGSDSLLVYCAGHGWLDDEADKG
ncbi:MAG TPA: caspase family protein [Azohydromonas sp.]|nr:caspase family protein [Azohydromonas sp.]